MVDPQQIEAWKTQYGRIYQVDEFIFRGITIGEYKLIASLDITSAESEERIALAAILYPEELDIDDMPAGVITGIAEQVTSISGFGDPKVARTLLHTKRQELDNVFTLIKALILAAMPAYTEEHLETLTFPVLVDKVVLAEHILRIKLSIASGESVELDLIDPEEEAVKAKQQAEKHNVTRKPGQATYGDPIADKLRSALG